MSDTRMYYGEQDAGHAVPVCTIVDTWQRGTYGKKNIDQVPVPSASHRSTFLTAIAGQLGWFNAKRGLPDAVTDLTASPIDGDAGATPSWTTLQTNGLPIADFRVQWKLATAAAWGDMISTSVRIALIDRDVPSYFRSLEHLLQYCARPPFALERLSVIRGPDGRIAQVRYVLPRHKAANWVGQGRGRKSTRPGAHGVVELTPFEFLDRLADLVPPRRKHRHRYHGVFAPNHKLRRAFTAIVTGNGALPIPKKKRPRCF